ncbi:unnamed protein product [Tetraodon nigroviridis]|uniref:(spotted green pufferfish) hypothetical protein n=1 Tax=Tetraodon nigroviridis TaxID=99883 RepID=Q4S5W5_TETNG|nr:unnamed protein product [Tetraodon nigroviridis]
MNSSDGASLITPSAHTGVNVTGESETTLLPFHTQKTEGNLIISSSGDNGHPHRRLCGDCSGHFHRRADISGSGLPAVPVFVPQQRRLQDHGGAGSRRGPG